MTTVINKDRYNALNWAVNYFLLEKDVDLYENGSSFSSSKIHWDVNWKAIGNTTPSSARQFAEDLQKAANMAEALNEMNLSLVWEDDEDLNALAAKNRQKAICRYNDFRMMLVDQLDVITTLDSASCDGLYELLTNYTI